MHKLNKVGAASMITVILVAIILTILSLGFIRLAINEQRSSTDDDLSTRAYFAAESGLEDVKRALKEVQEGTLDADPSSGDLNQAECEPPTTGDNRYDPVLSPSTELDIEYVCQLIDLNPIEYEYQFDGANETIQLPINPAREDGTLQPGSGYNELIIEWHMNADQADDGDGLVGTAAGLVAGRNGGAYTAGGQVDLYDVNEWITVRNHPAMLRANMITHRKNPSFTRTGTFGIDQYVVFLDPVENGDGDGGSTFPIGYQHATYKNGDLIPADCDPGVVTGEMFCRVEIGFTHANRQSYLRLTSLYRGTHIRLTIFQGDVQRYFSGVQAVADVTGRAGGVYRRVESRISLITPSIILDSALTSLNDICKDFVITDDIADFVGVDNTSCTTP